MTTPNPPHPTNQNPPPFTYPPHTSFPPFYTLQPNPSTLSSQLSSWTSLLLSYAAHHTLFRMSPSHPIFANKQINRGLNPAGARRVLQAVVDRGRGEWVAGGGGAVGGGTGGGLKGFWGGASGASGRDNSRSAAGGYGGVRDRNSGLAGAGTSGGNAGDSQEGDRGGEGDEIYLWFRTPEDWAAEIYKWVEDTGQKGSVLTLFELLDGAGAGGGGGGTTQTQTQTQTQETVGSGWGSGASFRELPPEMAKKVVERVLVRRGQAVVFGEGEGGRYGVKFF
ncbi:MAG: hypothetical protein M1831_000534 [Alyxoria varia]|nr:MAG: hypothetical protein M1831_000534 [Alyxoria varia]